MPLFPFDRGFTDVPRELADEELAAIAGGGGMWSRYQEEDRPYTWKYEGRGLSFEDWLKSTLGDSFEDTMTARRAWLALPEEERQNTFIVCYNGEVFYRPIS